MGEEVDNVLLDGLFLVLEECLLMGMFCNDF